MNTRFFHILKGRQGHGLKPKKDHNQVRDQNAENKTMG